MVRVCGNISRTVLEDTIVSQMAETVPNTFSFVCVFEIQGGALEKFEIGRFGYELPTAHVPCSLYLECSCRSSQFKVPWEP